MQKEESGEKECPVHSFQVAFEQKQSAQRPSQKTP